jgi:hypothetical protein
LLDRARDDTFRLKVLAITQFEDELNGHPFGNRRFKPVDYPKLLHEEGPERALFYWISYLGVGDRTLSHTNPYDLLFAHPNAFQSSDGTISHLYVDLGGAEPVLFWCDVVTSDSKYAPKKPLTEQMLNPSPLSRPISGPYPAYFFWRLPDVYDKRFIAQAWILGDFEKAVDTIEAAHRICGPLVPEAVYLRYLEELKDVISQPRQLSVKLKEARETRQLWQLAHQQIVDYHAAFQNSRFGQREDSSHVPNIDEVRQELIQQYASTIIVTFGGRAAMEREAKRIVDDLLEEAGGAKFVVRNTLIPSDSDRPEFLMLMHLSGCPHSQVSLSEQISIPAPTESDEEIGSGFQKVA